MVAGWTLKVRGYYITNRPINKRMVRRRIFFRSLLFEFNIWPEAGESNETLRNLLFASICEIRLLRGRFVDCEPLDALGPHIDWVALTAGKS